MQSGGSGPVEPSAAAGAGAGAGTATGGEGDWEGSERGHTSALNTFDFSAIEEMDPSLADGFKILYERECPFEMRLQESDDGPQEVGTLEAVRVKILTKDDEQLRVELTSESDLFFHFTHTADTATFRTIQEEQKLMVDFRDYGSVLGRSLNAAIKEPHTHLAVFVMHRDGHARLDFIQNMEYKFVELLSVDFARSSSEVVRQSITYRYNSMKSRLAIMQNRLQEVSHLVKLKNPSLLLQIQKPAQRTGSTAFGTSKASRFT